MKTRVRAVIIEQGKILLVHRVKPMKEYWVFPGGGLEENDVSPQLGLVRECREEIGVTVEVGELLMEEPLGQDQIELFFRCCIVDGKVGTGTGPEFSRDKTISGTYGLEWLDTKNLNGLDLQPERLKTLIPLLD